LEKDSFAFLSAGFTLFGANFVFFRAGFAFFRPGPTFFRANFVFFISERGSTVVLSLFVLIYAASNKHFTSSSWLPSFNHFVALPVISR